VLKPDARRFPLSAEAEALLARPDWERVSLADGDAAQALAPGIPAAGAMPLHEPESGPADDFEVDDTSGALFE